MHERMRKVTTAESALRRDGKPATAADVALATGLDVRTVDEVRALSKVTDSLDRIIGDGVPLGDLLSLPQPRAWTRRICKNNVQGDGQGMAGQASRKEADILCRRLGLNGENPKLSNRSAATTGVSRERIRQLEMKALIKSGQNFPRNSANDSPHTSASALRRRLTKRQGKSK